jgi:hypothetical protein
VDSSVTDATSLLALKSNDLAGFFDRERRLVSLYSSDRMAVDDRWIAVSEPDSVRILDPDGRLRSRIAVRAYPISRNGHLYLYDGSAGRLNRIDPSNGRVMWTKEYLASVTVLDGRQDRTLVGLLDGRIEVISEDGDVELEYRPGGSRVEAVYGGALSESGSSVALITGLDPQRFILMEEKKNGFRPILTMIPKQTSGVRYRSNLSGTAGRCCTSLLIPLPLTTLSRILSLQSTSRELLWLGRTVRASAL